MVKYVFCLITTLFLTTSSLASENLNITHLSEPIPVQSTDGLIIAYELKIVNQGNDPVRIGRIETYNQNALLTSMSTNRLVQNSIVYDAAGVKKVTTIELKKGMGVFIYLSFKLNKNQKLKTKLRHHIWLITSSENKRYANAQMITYDVPISQDKPLVIDFPLRGSQWVTVGGFSDTSYHRRAILPIDNQFYLAQRFAIDFERICSDGLEAHNDLHVNENWQAYGYDLLAVVDGDISNIATKSIPDNIPPGLPNPPPSLEDASGNFIILHTIQNKKDYYVLYAHLQPNSAKVKLGQKVKRGDVIGRLGNSGNSAAPHLHLHVMDANNPEKSNGLPFVFNSMSLQEQAHEIDEDFGMWKKPMLTTIKKFSRVMPVENQLLFFDKQNRACP